jgi:hypothetical protein
MSFTESGRLAQLQQTIRACTINDKIMKLQAQQRAAYGNSTAAGYGNSESGRISKLVAATSAGGCCFEAPVTVGTDCCKPTPVSANATIQTESSYIQGLKKGAEACGPSPLSGMISAGGISESQRIRRLQDSVVYVDYSVNPDARFLQYQRFFPTPCPPAPVANNLPLTQPRFPCAPNVVGFT